MKKIKNLFIIPARKNSRRLKNKNLTKIGKKRLVELSIEFALKVSKKENIYLSTDSKIIQKIGIKYGILCPKLRPAKLSRSNSKSSDVCLNALRNFEKLYNCKVENIVLLQPSSPFRSLNLFNKTYKIFNKNKKPTFTVSFLRENKILESLGKNIKFISKNNKNYYQVNGNLYIIKSKDLIKQKNFFGKSFNISIIKSNKFSTDIDTIYDLEKAKKYK